MKKLKPLIYILYLSLFAIPEVVLAKPNITNASNIAENVAKGAGVETGLKPEGIIGNLGRGAFSAVGLLFFILVVYGGFKWMLARGNEDEIGKARKTVIAALIGLAVVMLGYALTVFIGGII